MRVITENAIIHVQNGKVTINGFDYSEDCKALVSDHKDGTGTITLVFDGKVV
ncbi:hypothetical protein ACVRXQ_12060 [Streptococcus panodentis]|uniref:hypothetical protein n=1 Tax=Streptococcus panodentis TaxID=1581472 RepID=UPI001AE817E7|nr:hypothetical protein [Streptococcus panodentis]